MRRTTTGSAAPISAATTMATAMARAVSSRSGLRRVTIAAGGLRSLETLSCASPISLPQDPGEDPVQLGEVLVADLDRAAAARILERDLGAQLALQLLDEV